MADLQDIATNTDNPVNGGAWVYNAATNSWKNMVVIGVNLSGVADGSVLTVGGGGTVIEYASPAPVLLSGLATALGRSLRGDGVNLVDDEVLTILLRDAAPDPSDGYEGAYWFNRTTGLLHGPRGQDSAGLWPADTKSFLSSTSGVSKIPDDLLVVGTTIKQQTWPTLFEVTNFAVDQGDVDDETNGFVGFEVFIGSEAMGWAGFRPIGSNAGQVKHIRIGGHNPGGMLQDFSGSDYLTAAERTRLPLFLGINDTPSLAITAGTAEIFEISTDGADQEVAGAITGLATGVQIDEAGDYDAMFEVTIQNGHATLPAIFKSYLRVDGVNQTGIGAKEFVQIDPLTTHVSRVWCTRKTLAVGEVLSVEYELVDNVAYAPAAGSWGAGYGGVMVKRVG